MVLTVAKDKAAKVKDLVEKFKRDNKVGKLKLAIVGAIDTGEMTDQELIEFVEANKKTFPLVGFIQLLGDDPIGEVSHEHYEEYLDRRIYIDDEQTPLRLTNDNDETRDVCTLCQYLDATEAGYYAYSNADMKNAMWLFERPLEVLKIVSTSKVPEKSFIRTPRVGVNDLHLIPAELFLIGDLTPPEEEDVAAIYGDKSVQDLIEQHGAKVIRSSSNSITIELEQQDLFIYIAEIMRVDADGDGIEDLIIDCGGGPRTGTFRNYEIVVLRRTSNDDKFQIWQA